MSMAVGRSIWESVYLGSLAAACQVGRVGNVPIGVDELLVTSSESQGCVKILRADGDRSILLIAGAVPGARNGIVMVRKA